MEKLTIVNNTTEIRTFEVPDDENPFVTTVTRTDTGDVLQNVLDANETDALATHETLLCAALHPLQARFHNAGLEKGSRFTLVKFGEFGSPVAIMATLDHVEYRPYAQYDDNATVVFVPQGKRNPRMVHLHNEPFIVYGDWRPIPEDAVYNIAHPREGMTVQAAKHNCFDDAYMDDIKAAMPDYKVAWDSRTPDEQHEAARAKAAKSADEEPKPFIPREIIPGIRIDKDSEHGLFADLDMQTFEELFAAPDGVHPPLETKLLLSLQRSAIAAALHLEDDDGGTCNFDAPVLDYKTYGLTRDEADAAIKRAGLSCFDRDNMLVIHGFLSGQGNRRTKMAESFAAQMQKDGIPSHVHYQMD